MKLVFASERQRLSRERQKYLDKYESQLAEHNAQKASFDSAVANYSSDMEAYIKTLLESDMVALPGGVSISVTKPEWGNKTDSEYFIKITYRSDETKYTENKWHRNDGRRDISGGYLKGFNWKFTCYLDTETTEDASGNSTVNVVAKTNTRIEAELLDSNDIEAMKITYDMFNKLKNVDWKDVLNKIKSSVPLSENFIKTEHPGYKDTSKWDDAITSYNITRIMGKDLWIKVNIVREDSYDRYNSNNPGVDGWGWIKPISATDKFYQFYWLGNRYQDNPSYTPQTIASATRNPIKLKKIYIRVAEPIEYMSTEELTDVPVPKIEND